MAEQPAGNGFLGWLGRQLGHVRKAIKADVTRQTIHRQRRVEEARLPEQPNVMLRRTVIDEVIVDKTPQTPDKKPPMNTDEHG